MKRFISLVLGLLITFNAWCFTAKKSTEVDMTKWEEVASYYFSTKDESTVGVKGTIYCVLDNLEDSLVNNDYSIQDFNCVFDNGDTGMWIFYSFNEKSWFSISIHQIGEDDYYMWYTQYRRKLKKQTIRKAGDVKISDGKRAGVNTASTRASEVKEDYEWDE